MDEYTCNEIQKEISVLKKSFAIVRLVDPVKCKITGITTDALGHSTMEIKDTCYEVWQYSSQCTNCTSARALRKKTLQTKCELCGGKPFSITARPVIVDHVPLVLEIVQPFSFTNNENDAPIPGFADLIRTINQKVLLDDETHAFSLEYLNEHLPNIFSEAATQNIHTALVRLISYDTILDQFGPVAASGAIFQLYDLLRTMLTISDEPPVLVRVNKNTFFIIDKTLSWDDFTGFMESLKTQETPPHLLFQSKRLPFQIKIAYSGITKEHLKENRSLFRQLEAQLCDS